MKNLKIVLLLLVIFNGINLVTAQRISSPSIISGYTPAGASLDRYPLDGFLKVNEFNGGLSFLLPLGVARGRGDTSIPLNFYNEADYITVKHFDFTPPQGSGTMYHQYSISVDKYTDVKKSIINLGMVVARRSGDVRYDVYTTGPPDGTGATGYTRRCQTLSRVTFISPEGSEVELRDRATNGAVYGDNYGLGNQSPGLNRGRVFDSKDGTSMTFISDTDVIDPTCMELTGTIFPVYLTGTLYLSNGAVYKFENGKITSLLDRNGNKTVVEYTSSSSSYPLTKITSSNGQQTSIEYRDELVTIFEKGVGGRDKITKIHRGPIQLRSDRPLKTYYELFPAVTHSAPFSSGTSNYYPGDRINSVELPNGKTYQLYYNEYGELARVELPSGGAYEYDYSGQFGTYNGRVGDEALSGETNMSPGGNTSVTPDWAITRRVIKQRVYNTNNALETETSYTPGSTPNIINIHTRTANNVLLSNFKIFYQGAAINSFNSGRRVASYNPQFEGRELKKEIYDESGNLQRVIENVWEQTGTAQKPENERLKETKTTFSDTNLVSKKTFQYDSYNNIKDTFEYDYGFGYTDNFVRRTHTDYLTDSNYINSSGKRITGLPTQTWVSSDINGTNKMSLSQIEYDNYNSDQGHAALTPRNNVFGFDAANFGVGFTYRGNPTAITSYGNAPNQTQAISIYSQYDILGNALKTIDGKGYASVIDYTDRFGLPDNEAQSNSAPGELSGQQTFAFPTAGTNTLGWTTFTQFDFYTGLLVNTEDISGIISKTLYNDILDRPTQSFTAVGTSNETQSKNVYDENNRRIQITSDLNALNDNLIKSETFYDGLGRTVETRRYESDGSFITTKSIPFVMVQDPVTLIWRAATKASNPYRLNETPVWTTSLLDSLGRNIKTITPDGAIVRTEYSGNAVTVTDQAGKQRRSVTNALGQLKEVHEPNNAGQLGPIGSPNQPTYYSYDVLNNLIQVQQNGTDVEQCGGTITSCSQTRTFVYDSLSRLKQATNPESGTTTYQYDNNGNLMQRTDARSINAVYAYDALNRITTRTYSDGVTLPVTYTYDNVTNAKGKLTKVVTGNTASPFSVTEYQAFDPTGRVTQSQQSTNGTAPDPMTYTYNISGALIEQKYPSGRVVKNVLDNDGELSIVQSKKNANSGYWNYAKSFTYAATGSVSSMQLGNGKWESTQFNERLQPIQIALGTVQNGTDKLKLNFNYGTTTNNGNVLSQQITVPTIGSNPGFVATQTYQYDALNRLKQATETIPNQTGWQQTFDYDRYGNRRFNEAGTTASIAFPKNCGTAPNNTVCPGDIAMVNPTINPAKNQLNGATFDNAGNTVKDAQNRKFTYDAENKQTKVETVDANNNVIAVVGEYFYDGDGKRVKKYVPSTGEVTIFIYDAAGKLVAEYANQISQAPTVSYLTNDHLGSPRINTDQNGLVTARHDYQPFGEEITRAGYSADSVRKQFTAYERDKETNLDFAQARMFGSGVGRFTSPDPAMLSMNANNPQTFNRYAYVLNNPLLYTDPLGLWSIIFTPVYKQKDGKPTNEIDYYIAVAVKTKGDEDTPAELAKQLGLTGKEAEKFTKNFAEKLADGKITGDNVQLSKLGGTVGRVFGIVQDLYSAQKKYEAKNSDGMGPNDPTYADCSTTSANLNSPRAGANRDNWDVGKMDEFIRNNLKSIAEGKLKVGDVARYARDETNDKGQVTNRNAPQHFTTFLFMSDDGDPMVFSRSGEKGPFEIGKASDFARGNYGTIRGIGKDATGYYGRR